MAKLKEQAPIFAGFPEKLAAFVKMLTEHQQANLLARDMACEANMINHVAVVRGGIGRFVKVDVGTSGKYMVEVGTGRIYFIKGYGVVHYGYLFGTLDTINDWDWSDYMGRPIGGPRVVCAKKDVRDARKAGRA